MWSKKQKTGIAFFFANPSMMCTQVAFPLGAKEITYKGKKYAVDDSKFYFITAKIGGRKIRPCLFFAEGKPEPIEFTDKFKETIQYGGDETYNLTGVHLYAISQESATGRGILSVSKAMEGPGARKIGWLFWLVIIGLIAAVIVIAGPSIINWLKGAVA